MSPGHCESFPSRRLGPWLLRTYRLGVLLMAGWALFLTRPLPSADIPLDLVKKFLPDALELSSADPASGGHYVLDDFGDPIGYAMRTSPFTDHIIGYSGPSDCLIVLNSANDVIGVELLKSADTADHVRLVLEDPDFLQSLVVKDGESTMQSDGESVSLVSGATLTSSAIARSIRSRVGGSPQSFLFPYPVELEEVMAIYPEAASLEPSSTQDGLVQVRDDDGKLLGSVMRSAPYSDEIIGYKGPTDMLLALSPEGDSLAALRIRETYETEEYVSYVTGDPAFFARFKGMPLIEFSRIDYQRDGIGGVSGATRTSLAALEAARVRAGRLIETRRSGQSKLVSVFSSIQWGWRDTLIVFWIATGVLFAWTPLRGYKRLRLSHKIGLVVILGFLTSDMVSLVVFQGWGRSGLPWQNLPGLTLLTMAALILPWLTGRQVYCHHICPHGAAQQLVNSVSPWKWKISERWIRVMSVIPVLLLAVALVLSWGRSDTSLADLEPFDAYVIRTTAIAPVLIAVAGVVMATGVPLAYCRFGCPTGLVFRFVRSRGAGDRFTLLDRGGLFFLLASIVVIVRHYSMQPL